MFNLRLLRTNKLDLFKQLMLEESIYAYTHDSICIMNYNIPKPYVVIGAYNNPQNLVNINQVLNDNISVIRRFSAGGTVYVDNNSFFLSLILNGRDLKIGNYRANLIGPREVINWSSQLLNPIFNNELIIKEYMDYCINDKKIAGNAQKMGRDRFVHHTSYLWDYDINNINKYLSLPDKQPDYREKRDHEAFMTKISNLSYFNNDFNKFENTVYDRIINYFNQVGYNVIESTLDDLDELIEQAKSQNEKLEKPRKFLPLKTSFVNTDDLTKLI